MLFIDGQNYIDLNAKNEHYFRRFVALIVEHHFIETPRALDWLIFQENFQVKVRQDQN